MKTAPASFAEMKYFLKAGKLPSEKREVHRGNWNLVYGDKVLTENVPYPIAVNFKKTYQQFGYVYPDRTKFKILPSK